MFRSGNFEKLLEKATSNLLMEQDWPTILQICDLIRQNDVQPKIALNGIKKKTMSTNPHTSMYAVQLLESMVKNCGNSLHEELTTPAYCESMHEIVKTTLHENVRQKMLELIQAWNFAFRKNPKYSALKDTMNLMKSEGYKFPVMRESDAMFSADTAPKWSDGEVCHRCRVQFTLVLRKHHCRACGQVFCSNCSSKNSTLPKFGIEKEVRVCEACYDQVNKPIAAATVANGGKDADMVEYLKSSLAQQSQTPPRKTEEELREEEEFQLALALSQSEAEHKEKEKMRVTSAYHTNFKEVTVPIQNDRTPSPEEQQSNPELARYLNRTYWENRQSDGTDIIVSSSPSAPATIHNSEAKSRDNTLNGGLTDVEMEEFVKTLKSQVEIFINRMKSNSSRGRSIATDSSVQTLFMNITAMHSRLLRYIQQHDDSRLHYERLQDKLTQVKDARAALDALREEHRDKLRRQAEEAERQRQMQMAHKLDIMRKKKQEYLQYQRQMALHRIQEQEREMQMRQEQQKQQYIMAPQYAYMGSPVHGQFPPNSAPARYGYPYGPPMMHDQQGVPIGHPQMGHPMQFHPNMGAPPMSAPPQNLQPQPNMQQQMQPQPNMQQQMQPQPNMQQQMQPQPNMQQQHNMQPQPNMQQQMQPQPNMQQQPNMQMHTSQSQTGINMPQYQQQPPGAPPASPQIPQAQQNGGGNESVAELISFD